MLLKQKQENTIADFRTGRSIAVYCLLVCSVFLFAFTGCSSGAPKNDIPVASDTVVMDHPASIVSYGDKTYLFSSVQYREAVCIKKSLLDLSTHSAKLIDSVLVENAYLRYLGTDKQHRVYLSCLPIQENAPLKIKSKAFPIGTQATGLKLIYVLDGNSLTITDSITYTGNNINLTRGEPAAGIFTATHNGICILNRMDYAPRSNKLDNLELAEDSTILFSLYYKSGSATVLLPIRNTLLDDFNRLPEAMKYYVNHVGGIKASNIRLLADEGQKLYFTFDCTLTVNHNDTGNDISSKGASHFCQLFAIDKQSGTLEKYLTFRYEQPVKMIRDANGISYTPGLNIQQLRTGPGRLLFSISAIKDCKELNIPADSVATAIVDIDVEKKQHKVLPVAYRPDQLINLFRLTDDDLQHEEHIRDIAVYKGFDYLGWGAKGVYLDQGYTLFEKIITRKKGILFFK